MANVCFAVQEKAYKVHWNRSWRVSLKEKEHQPFITNIFDRIFILDGNRVMVPPVNDISPNETMILREIGRIKQYHVVKFVRVRNNFRVIPC